MAARARSAPLGRSRWPLEPARLRWGARDGRLSPLGLAGALDLAARARSALELTARARSAPLGRSKWPLEPARIRWGARNGRSGPLGSTGVLEMAARARSAPLGRSTWPLDPARFRWGARHGRLSPLGSVGTLEMAAAARARSAPLARSTRQSRTKTNRSGQTKLTQRRFTGQDHECLLHSTQRRTYSCMECTGTH